MEVITRYPIVISRNDAQTNSDFRSTYSAANGMDVITDYPIVISNSSKESEDDYRSTYSAATGSERRARRRSRQAKGQGFGQKLKKGFQNLAQSGVLQSILGAGAVGAGAGAGADLPPSDSPDGGGMSKGAKTALIVGGVIVVGVGAWLLLRKKKK